MSGRSWLRSWMLALLFLPLVAMAGEPGWFGLSVHPGIGWSLNLDSAVVSGVAIGSPAEKAGISVGDAITNVEGCAVPGCGAYKAKGLMVKSVGESLHLGLKRPSGEEYSATLVAVPPPSRKTP